MKAIVFSALLCAVASGLFAQSTELRFEAVVIKPLGPIGAPPPGVGEIFHPGGIYRDPATTLRGVIQDAYDFDDLGMKITGLPKWAETAGFAITAKPGASYPANISDKQNRENIRAMLRSMLADRFQLKIRREEKPTGVLALRVKPGGARLRPALASVPKEEEDRLVAGMGDRGGILRGKKVTIARLVDSLSLFLHQRVEDKTGLAGFYEFDEQWTTPVRDGDPVPSNSLGPDGLAQLVSVLDQNLGLVLKSETCRLNSGSSSAWGCRAKTRDTPGLSALPAMRTSVSNHAS